MENFQNKKRRKQTMNCPNCEYGEIVKYTNEEIITKRYQFPNIGKCDICQTEYVMHNGSEKILAVTVYGAVKKVTSAYHSLMLYQRISFSLINQKPIIIATNISAEIIDHMLKVLEPVKISDGIVRAVVIDCYNQTISIAPLEI